MSAEGAERGVAQVLLERLGCISNAFSNHLHPTFVQAIRALGRVVQLEFRGRVVQLLCFTEPLKFQRKPLKFQFHETFRL